jgi:hypothetical protein
MVTATYCSTSDLVNVTGSDLDSTKLTAIIEGAQREIDAYCKARGVTASATTEVKEACLKLSTAGIDILGGGYSSSATVYVAVNELRAAAFRILDDYIASQVSSRSATMRTFVRRVNGV